MRLRHCTAAAFALLGLAASACLSPTVTIATDKPIEIQIDLRHEVRVTVERDVAALIGAEETRSQVMARSGNPSDEALLRAAKERRALGEQSDGYVASISNESADIALAERTNSARRAEYEALAAQHGVAREQIERVAGAKRLREARDGELVREPGGAWIEKREGTVIEVD